MVALEAYGFGTPKAVIIIEDTTELLFMLVILIFTVLEF